MKKNIHLDCANYISVDAFKGLCQFDKSERFADDQACGRFESASKCKYCKCFTSEDEFLGLCKNTHRTFPDLSAKTCEDFAWKS